VREPALRTVDRVLAFVCAVTAVFALSFAAGRMVGPVGPVGPVDPSPDPPAPTQEHDGDH
jgi:hypothetical protein